MKGFISTKEKGEDHLIDFLLTNPEDRLFCDTLSRLKLGKIPATIEFIEEDVSNDNWRGKYKMRLTVVNNSNNGHKPTKKKLVSKKKPVVISEAPPIPEKPTECFVSFYEPERAVTGGRPTRVCFLATSDDDLLLKARSRIPQYSKIFGIYKRVGTNDYYTKYWDHKDEYSIGGKFS